jgi:phosphoribosylaminoimidazole carboxylase
MIMQMPRGVPVATVAINNATNAGLLAVRMLGIQDADLLARLRSLSLSYCVINLRKKLINLVHIILHLLSGFHIICRMSQYQEDTRNGVLTKAEKLEKDGWESYLNP